MCNRFVFHIKLEAFVKLSFYRVRQKVCGVTKLKPIYCVFAIRCYNTTLEASLFITELLAIILLFEMNNDV